MGAVSIKPFGVTTLTQRVAAASDDAEEEGPTGTTPNRMWLDSSDIELVSDFEPNTAGVQKVGLRFTGMNIPVGATITSAHLVFRAVPADPGMTNSDATNLTLRGQLIGDAPTFTTTSGNISSRALTSASTAWTPTAWTSGSDYNSPDISSVVQEIVDQGTWASANSLAIIITGTGHRASQAYDTSPSTAAQLVVTYTANNAPTATNLSTAETYTEDTALNLTDIVISDVDSATVTATLTLSNAAAGSLNTATSGAVTSTYNAGTGVWTASGAIANVNSLLAGLTFTPAANFNGSFTIATSVSDGSLAVTGSKALSGTPVNDAPSDITFDADSGSQSTVNVYGASDQIDSAIAAFNDGGFVIVWVSNGQDGSGYGVYGQRYNADGTKNGAEFLVTSEVTDSETSPSVATFADGGFVVAWQDQTSGVMAWTEARVFNANGTAATGEFKVSRGRMAIMKVINLLSLRWIAIVLL